MSEEEKAAASTTTTAKIVGPVVLCGHLKKLKTSKKKFFMLRGETPVSSACLEYYDSERKYKRGLPPKRSIPLKHCFNINRKLDHKHKHIISLYTKDDCFSVYLDSEEDADSWLKALLKLQHGDDSFTCDMPMPAFDGEFRKRFKYQHVWSVSVLNRGVADVPLMGAYRLCLTDKTLTLIKKDGTVPDIELNLINIRSCGSLRDFFFLEVGRSSALGAGELWMETEDNFISHNIHTTVFHAMTANISSREDFAHENRVRSLSNNETSRRRNPSTLNPRTHLLSQDSSLQTADIQPIPSSSSHHPFVSGVASIYQHLIQRGTFKASGRRHSISGTSGGPPPTRDRCDSVPSRARTTSEGNPSMQIWNTRAHASGFRPSSLYHSHSPPTGSPVSPPSAGCSTDSGSSYSLADEADGCTELDPLSRYGHCLTPDEAIAEEDCVESPTSNYVPMAAASSDDGYVDMSPRGQHHNSPTASLSSVTSGTPSTDMRFVEYPLEKVSSYFTEEDDDTRPTRAYSVGSKPEGYSKKSTESTTTTNNDSLRARALSVGSKTKRVLGRVLPLYGHHPPQSTKSSSAPLLSNSRTQGSHSSIGPMDDLMEMDFSRPSSTSNNSSYVDMRQGARPKHGGYVEMKLGGGVVRKPDPSPYVEMVPGGSSPTVVESSTNSQDYLEMDPRKTWNVVNNDYLPMSFRPNSYQISPAKTSIPCGSPFGSPKTETGTPDGYVEMSLGRGHQRQSSLDAAEGGVNEDYANMSMGKKRDRKKLRCSQPIAIIQNTPKLLPRKYSSGTPPMHLPLSENTTSLPRSRKNSHRGDSSSSSSVTTPSSSSTIFPLSLNSPCSPVKLPKKDDDYTRMDFTPSSDHSEYVNYSPAKPPPPTVEMRTLHLADATFRPINENPKGEKSCLSLSSRPSSASSEVCSSSGSTIVGGSRSGSVSSSDAQLHYASLDLEEGSRSPRNLKSGGGGTSTESTNNQVEATLTYASIDFAKSEGLKHSSLATNAKIKH